MQKNVIVFILSILLILTLPACSGKKTDNTSAAASIGSSTGTSQPANVGTPNTVTQLTVRFGDGGDSFTLYLEDNDTAEAIARHVGTADWRLPIYHFDDYEGWESFQYYDIPSWYEIPSNAEAVTSETAGQVYYSDPNRIILFYQDAEISGEYTLVGHFDPTEEFVTAVEENPVLEGWGNKIVNISAEN